MRRLVAALVVACALALPAGAQRSAPSADAAAATAVADSLFRAAAGGRWREAARLVDLARFELLRRERVGSARGAMLPTSVTAEELMATDSGMPREVAEYQARRMRESSARLGVGHWLSHDFADVTSVDTLAALPVEAAAARWLEAQTMRYLLRRAYDEHRARGCQLPPDDVLLPPERPRVVLGAVVRDSLAYVLHREPDGTFDEPPPSAAVPEERWATDPPAVLVLRRVGTAWRVAPTTHGVLGGRMGGVTIDVSHCRSR